MPLTLGQKAHATWANAVSTLMHQLDPAHRRKLYALLAMVVAALLVLISLRAAFTRLMNTSPSAPPRILAAIDAVRKGKLKQQAWERENHKPLPCSPVYVPLNVREKAAIIKELPPNIVLYAPGTVPPAEGSLGSTPDGIKMIAASIAATGRVRRGECKFGCDVFGLRPLDGTTEFVSIHQDNPFFGIANEWTFKLAIAESTDYGIGGKIGIEWQSVGIRLGKLPVRAYPYLGATGQLFSNKFRADAEAGLAFH